MTKVVGETPYDRNSVIRVCRVSKINLTWKINLPYTSFITLPDLSYPQSSLSSFMRGAPEVWSNFSTRSRFKRASYPRARSSRKTRETTGEGKLPKLLIPIPLLVTKPRPLISHLWSTTLSVTMSTSVCWDCVFVWPLTTPNLHAFYTLPLKVSRRTKTALSPAGQRKRCSTWKWRC